MVHFAYAERLLLWGWCVLGLSPILCACTCVEVGRQDAKANALAVFQGTVVSVINAVDGNASSGWLRDTGSDQQADMVVTEVWKGRVASRIQVRTVAHPGMCSGFSFVAGEEYIVYAARPPHHRDDTERGPRLFYVAKFAGCPSRVRTDVQAESRWLGRGHPPDIR